MLQISTGLHRDRDKYSRISRALRMKTWMLLWRKVGEIKFKFFNQSTNNKIYWNVHVLQILMAKLSVGRKDTSFQLLNGKLNQCREENGPMWKRGIIKWKVWIFQYYWPYVIATVAVIYVLFFVRQFFHFDNVGHKAKCCGCFDNQENENKKWAIYCTLQVSWGQFTQHYNQ